MNVKLGGGDLYAQQLISPPPKKNNKSGFMQCANTDTAFCFVLVLNLKLLIFYSLVKTNFKSIFFNCLPYYFNNLLLFCLHLIIIYRTNKKLLNQVFFFFSFMFVYSKHMLEFKCVHPNLLWTNYFNE